MTKVEELRARLDRVVCASMVSISVTDFHETLDFLIAAAREEGFEKGKAEGDERLQEYTAKYLAEGIKRCDAALAQGRAEGAEQIVQKIQKAAYRCKPGETLHINNSIPMLVLVSSVVNPEDTDFEPKHYRCTWNKEPFGSCEDYRKAGGQAEHCPWFEDKDDHLHLSPAPKEEK